ncbi:efflux RND transporter permease subunit [Shewanella japonica]|uniref:efflux RND transporter permease subunit n=1 Tax=Shewanella japonica TaxID=93973 RepID=UPI000E74187C|nr:RND transporter [Shewanella japonica]
MNWQLSLIAGSQKHPFGVWATVLLLVLLSIIGATKIDLDVNFNDYFAHDDAGFVGLNQLQQTFVREDGLLLLLENEQDWRQPEQQSRLLDFIEYLQSDQHISAIGGYATFIERLPLVNESSVVTGQKQALTQSLTQSLTHSQSSSQNQSISGSLLLSYKQHPRLPLVLSDNGKAIILSIEFSQNDMQQYSTEALWRLESIDRLQGISESFWSVKAATASLVPKFNQAQSAVKVLLSGEQALNWQYAKVLRHDLSWFAPSLFVIIGLMALFFIQARLWLFAIALNCAVTLAIVLGVAGWFNLTIAAISAFIPVIIITLSLAYSAHLYLGWQAGIKAGDNNPLIFSFSHNKQPLLYATLTTILGFGLLAFSPSPPIQVFGILVAIAVACHYLLCHSLLATIVSKANQNYSDGKLHVFVNPVVTLAKRAALLPKSILMVVGLVSVLALLSASKLELNDDPLNYFPDDNPFTQSKLTMQQDFFGINLLYFEVGTGSVPMYDKQYLGFLFQFARFLQQQPEVNHVTHIGDWVKSAGLSQSQLKRIMTQHSVSDIGLEAEISSQYQSSLITVYLTSLTAQQMLAFEAKTTAWLAANKTALSVSPALGSSLLFAHLSIHNANSMLWSFGIALVALSLVLGFLKKSPYFALVGLMVNFLPLLWVFAIWQLVGGYISIGSAVVLGIMLGIIVDDTLHLLLKLPEPQTSDIESRATYLQFFWMHYAGVIPVICFTSLTLVLGFGIGLASDFAPIAQLSLLSCMVILLAWIFDVFVLPVIYQLRRQSINDN